MWRMKNKNKKRTKRTVDSKCEEKRRIDTWGGVQYWRKKLARDWLGKKRQQKLLPARVPPTLRRENSTPVDALQSNSTRRLIIRLVLQFGSLPVTFFSSDKCPGSLLIFQTISPLNFSWLVLRVSRWWGFALGDENYMGGGERGGEVTLQRLLISRTGYLFTFAKSVKLSRQTRIKNDLLLTS